MLALRQANVLIPICALIDLFDPKNLGFDRDSYAGYLVLGHWNVNNLNT